MHQVTNCLFFFFEISNAYKCESCDKKVFARKRILLKHAPKVLAIQLKRFQYNIFGSSTKVTKHISFSEELDLNPFLPQQEVRHFYLSFGNAMIYFSCVGYFLGT